MTRLTDIITLCFIVSIAAMASSCASYSEQIRDARMSVAAGNVDQAIAAYDELLDVDDTQATPDSLDEDRILLLLERATLLQAQGNYAQSARDMMAVDQRLEWLDIDGTNAGDIAKYLYSDDSSNYRAPPYERLMLNTLNMLNFIGTQDLESARVEARRFTIMESFYLDSEGEAIQPELLRLGNYIAGAVFEASMDHTKAARYYARAFAYGLQTPDLRARLVDLFRLTTYMAKELEHDALEDLRTAAQEQGPLPYDDYVAAHQVGDTLVVVQHGMVPYKEAVRIPAATALATAGGVTGRRAMTPRERARAQELIASGAFNSINFPQLTRAGLPQASISSVSVSIDGDSVPLALGMNVTALVEMAWARISGTLIIAAISRALARAAVGNAGQAGKNAALESDRENKEALGALSAVGGLALKATMAAKDTPDTRSWTSLPALIQVGRVKLPQGMHTAQVTVSGRTLRQQTPAWPDRLNLINFSQLR